MHEHLARFDRQEGVLFVGRAQEKTPVCSAPRSAATPRPGESYPWIVRATGVVNQFYFYAVDEDFGPFFLKFCSYFPYNAKLCLNGHEWAKRQAGEGRDRLRPRWTTGSPPAPTRPRCRRSATGFGPSKIDALLRKWLADPAAPVHARRIGRPATATTSPSCRPSSP